MILHLDPRRAIVWRTPRSVQIGVDPALVVLDPVSDGDARLIAALNTGVTRAGLAVLAQAARVAPERVDELLVLLAPALGSAPRRESPPARIAVVGRAASASCIARMIAEAGHPVITAEAGDPGLDDHVIGAAILVSRHVVDPLEHLRWLRRDIAHLPIVLGELSATIGPLVVPGHTACLACVEQHRTAVDAAWPAIAAQLWNTPAAADTPLMGAEAAAAAVWMLHRTGGESLRIAAHDGGRRTRQWEPSPRCGCLGLELSETQLSEAPLGEAPLGEAPLGEAPLSAAVTLAG